MSVRLPKRARNDQTGIGLELKSHYDSIVCGPGSSGSLVARRLAENPGETKSNSNSFEGFLPAGAPSRELASWQVRATAFIALLGPPAASLILFVIYYLEYWRAVPFNFADLLIVFLLLAVPVGYVAGTVPALLAASLYCALISANSRRKRRLFMRASVGAICGSVASWVWFCEWLGASSIYGSVGGLVMAVLSLGSARLAPNKSGINREDLPSEP